MSQEITQIIRDVGFDFHWSEEKVWALDEPVREMEIAELDWHFDVPFLDHARGRYNLTPRAVMAHPEDYTDEYERTMMADLAHPIDIMENKGRWLILDGLHRLMKAYMQKMKTVYVRVIPRDRIDEIREK